MKGNVKMAKTLLTVVVIGSSVFLWVKGFLYSPMWIPELKSEKEYLNKYIMNNSPNHKQEKLLAEAYWLRYKDVMEHKYWGRNGPQSIWGPRDHYKLHGRREGRIFAPISHPKDLQLEAKLARVYWQRYPDIAKSPVWGKKSQLGILGPRDHFRYLGRRQGKFWGIQQEK